ncbi:MAG TPA: hypothetical protein ENN03_09440 [bacterium]|nr:hypothetical protein [bacterium]
MIRFPAFLPSGSLRSRGQISCLFFVLLFSFLEGQELSERAVRYRPQDWITFSCMRDVHSIALGHDEVYFGTSGGIARSHRFQNRWLFPFTVSDGLDDNVIRIVDYDHQTGLLWCSTRRGLNFYRSGTEQWRRVSYRTIPVDGVDRIGSGERALWIQKGDDIWQGDPWTFSFSVSSFEKAVQDRVQWARTQPGDLPATLILEGGYHWIENRVLDPLLRTFPVTVSAADRFERMWIGTEGLGVLEVDTGVWTGRPIFFGPWTSRIDAMAWSDRGLWMGGEDPKGGITHWDRERNQWTTFEARAFQGLLSHRVRQILDDGRRVWFATQEGLAVYRKESGTWRTLTVFDNLPGNDILSLAHSGNHLWVGSSHGLSRVDASENVEPVEEKGLTFVPFYFLECRDSLLWAGTDRGIVEYRIPSGPWRWLQGHAGIMAHNIYVVSALENEVWFGTDDGVEVLDRAKNTWRGFPRAHYFQGDSIRTLLADHQTIWVGTQNGLIKYVKSENRWVRYTINDGLPDNRVSWLLLDGDYLWIGTRGGLVRFFWNAPYRID